MSVETPISNQPAKLSKIESPSLIKVFNPSNPIACHCEELASKQSFIFNYDDIDLITTMIIPSTIPPKSPFRDEMSVETPTLNSPREAI
jgi:hypothetical protein